MQISVLRPVVNFSTITKQITRAISVTSDRVDTKEHTTLKPWTEIPGPKSLPIIGTIHQFLPGGELYKVNVIDLMHTLQKLYGPIVRLDTYIGQETKIFLYDASSVEQIHRGENEFPIRNGLESLVYYRKSHKEHADPNEPTGLLTEQGKLWKEFRSTVNPVLLQPKTIKLYTEALDEVTMEMIKRMKSERDENNQLKDFDKELKLWSLESIGVVALGCRMNCFDHNNMKEDSPVCQMIDVVHKNFIAGNKLDFQPSLWKIYATPTFKKAMKTYEHQEILTEYFIDEAVKEIKSNPKLDEQKGVLEKLLEINQDIAYKIASDLLFAGVDTTTQTVLAILYFLAKNTEKQHKLREELRTNPGNKAYLNACVKEGLRLMPPSSANMRELSKEYNILGYKIPKGCTVVFGHHTMSLMEQYFVRPDEYLPERWIAEKDDALYYKNAHPFAYNPFGFGSRSCIGRRIAELEIENFIRRVIENYELEWFGPPAKLSHAVVNYIEGPLNFIFKDAKL